MNTRTRVLCLFTCIIHLLSCEKSENGNDLVSQLHGKYLPTKVRSDIPVDVNFDGLESTDLLSEIPVITEAELHLKVKNVNIYAHYWPEQTFLTSDQKRPDVYDPSVTVNYIQPASVGTFDVNDELNGLIVTGIEQGFTRPENVEIEGDKSLIVIINKDLYTKNGWRNTKITIWYKKYTSKF